MYPRICLYMYVIPRLKINRKISKKTLKLRHTYSRRVLVGRWQTYDEYVFGIFFYATRENKSKPVRQSTRQHDANVNFYKKYYCKAHYITSTLNTFRAQASISFILVTTKACKLSHCSDTLRHTIKTLHTHVYTCQMENAHIHKPLSGTVTNNVTKGVRSSKPV